MDLSSLSSISPLLAGLSPTAQLVVLVLIVGLIALYKRYLAANAGGSTIPSPTPNAATQPSLLAGIAPLLNDALVALGKIPAKGATVNHVDHATLVQLASDVGAVTDAHQAIHATAAVDLQPDPPATPATPAVTAAATPPKP